MERVEIESRVKEIFTILFNREAHTISAASSPNDVQGWDSQQHLNIVTSVEEAFGISLDEDRVVEMLSFGIIVDVVDNMLNGTVGASPH